MALTDNIVSKVTEQLKFLYFGLNDQILMKILNRRSCMTFSHGLNALMF